MKLFKVPFYVVLILCLTIGCGGSGGGGGQSETGSDSAGEPDIENIRFYGDARDDRIVSFNSDGKKLTFYGPKNADGMPLRVEQLHLVDSSNEYTIFYNAYGLPERSIDHADGTTARFQYETSLVAANAGTASDVAINAVYTHLIRKTNEGIERQAQGISVPLKRYAAIGAPEVNTGNVQIDVKHCGAEAPKITNVRLRYYYSGGNDYWVDARPSNSVAGRYFASLPEHTDYNSGSMSLADMCTSVDQTISLTCQAGDLHTRVLQTCYMLAVSPEAPISIPACTAAFSAYEFYCLSAPAGTGPGTSLGEFTCERVADFEEYITPQEEIMEVQAYIYEDGYLPGTANDDGVHASEIKTVPKYGDKEIYFDIYLEEPAFNGFSLSPRPVRIEDDYTVTADFHCVQDALLRLTVESSGAPALTETEHALDPNVAVSLDVPGRSYTENTSQYDSSLIKVVADRSGETLLSETMVWLWKKPDAFDPSLPVVTISASDATMTEPNDTGSFTIRREGGDTGHPLRVYFTIGGTASIADYLFENVDNSMTVSIPAGAETATITGTTLDDNISEGPETIVMALVTDGLYQIGDASEATIYLYDNDAEIITDAGSLSGSFWATCSSGYGDGSDFSMDIATDGSITGTYDWGDISGTFDNRAVSLELDGDWSDCSMEGTLSGSGTGLAGSGTVYCYGDDCHGQWQATYDGLTP